MRARDLAAVLGMQQDDEIPHDYSSHREEMEATMLAQMLETARRRKGNEASKRNPYMHWSVGLERRNTSSR